VLIAAHNRAAAVTAARPPGRWSTTVQPCA